MSENQKILQSVTAALEQEPDLDLRRFPLHISFADGDLVLEGEVQNIASKKLALELGGAVSGSIV